MASGFIQYVILRTDLKNLGWPLGAVVAQACHGTASCLDQFKEDENVLKYLADGSDMHKVVLGIESEDKLKSLSTKLKESEIDHIVWVEHPEDIATCLVIKPYDKDFVKKLVKKLRLLQWP